MRSRLGEPITVAGNPPVKFASASFEAENETHRPPSFPLFLARVFLNDFFSIGLLRITEGLIFTILYICLLRLGGHPIASAVIALMLTEVTLVLTLRRDQEVPRRQRMGSRSRDAVLVLAALCLLLRAGLLLRLVPGDFGVFRRDDPLESHPAVDGMSDRPAGQS